MIIILLKKLTEEFEGQFTCLGENTEKYITFSNPIEKEVTRINKNGKEITKSIAYKLQFIDSASSLSDLVNNSAEGIRRIKCKNEHNNKKNVKPMELNKKLATNFLNIKTLKTIYQNKNLYVVTRTIKKSLIKT